MKRFVAVLAATLFLGSGVATWAACGYPSAPTVTTGGVCSLGIPNTSCSPDTIVGGGCWDDGTATNICTPGPTTVGYSTYASTFACLGGCVATPATAATTAGIGGGPCRRG